MSCTEIYGFDKQGIARWYRGVHNSWTGAWYVWSTLEKKYLPSLPKRWSGDDAEYISRLLTSDASDVWNLVSDKRLEAYERILLLSTMDKALVEVSKLPEFISVLEKWIETYPGESNHSQQIEVIKLLMQEDISAVGFNATSVNCDTYTLADEEEGIEGYNYHDHSNWFVFEKYEDIMKEGENNETK